MVYKGKDFLDYYSLLGLDPEDDQEEIEARYLLHIASQAVVDNEIVEHAFATLRDRITRQEYDYVWRSYYDNSFFIPLRWWEESALYGAIQLVILVVSLVLLATMSRDPVNATTRSFYLTIFSLVITHYAIFPIARFLLGILRGKWTIFNGFIALFSLGAIVIVGILYTETQVPAGWPWEFVPLAMCGATMLVILRLFVQIWLIEPRVAPQIRRGVDLGLLAATIFFVLQLIPDTGLRYWLIGCAVNSYFLRL
jgi:hypothetical protein